MAILEEGTARPTIAPKTKQRLLESVKVSPVTIVVGPTGCGKSTQVPPFLLDNVGGPILCTQPRRLAVVAVASRVAEERGVPLGGLEVGYHVGQANHSLATTKLVFTTAGILLEELRANGIKALTKYKVVVLDECHERSPEQELCLAMCKLFLTQKRQSNLRLVLMSATFDHNRYKNYFGLDTPIDTITLETANMIDAMYERVDTLYLEDMVKMIGSQDTTGNSKLQHSRFIQSMRSDPDGELKGEDGGKSLSLDLLSFLRSLVLHLHEEEQTSNVFLIFAPTYRHLEQIYNMLLAINEVGGGKIKPWHIGVLHSSMDLEDCIREMQASADGEECRKILLASAIADSSVTIPGVSVVIDLCRALQVQWNSHKKHHDAKTTWASQSISNQRRGRTGRTCPGRCFRLVNKGVFLQHMEPFDEPLLAVSSCRNELLKLLCSVTNSSTDPIQIMDHCLDPPPSGVVKDAFKYLESIGACVAKGKKGKYVATKMGDLLAALPLTVEDSLIVVVGAKLGLLHETLALRAIMSHKPAPIVHHFGDDEVNNTNILCYYDRAPLGTKDSLYLANLSAYLYWDVTWNQSRSRTAVEDFAFATGSSKSILLSKFMTTEVDTKKPCCNVWRWCPSVEEFHSQWCRGRGINPTSVRGVEELINTTLNVLYSSDLEPEWLRSTNPTPLWRRFEEWKGRNPDDCVNSRDVLYMVYGIHDASTELSRTLLALSADPIRALADITKEDMSTIFGLTSSKPLRNVNTRQAPLKEVACVHFLEGKCTFGSSCRNSHSPYASRPVCKFFASKDGCNKGENCIFSHDGSGDAEKVPNSNGDPLRSIAPVLDSLSLPKDIFDWFEEHHRNLLLLGDGNFEFTRSLSAIGVAPTYATDINAEKKKIGYTQIFNLDATRMHTTTTMANLFGTQKVSTLLWNFPFTADESDESNESLVLGTFHSVLESFRQAIRTTQHPLGLTFAIVLQGDQFSRWSVLKLAQRTGWRLHAWGEFDLSAFPGYKPRRANGEAFLAGSPRFYEFKIHSSHLRF